MSFLDWIPTIEEVADFVECRVMGHSWVWNGNKTVIYCEHCGKVKK
jgi:hypothetical protein